jgi:hypothetical protein
VNLRSVITKYSPLQVVEDMEKATKLLNRSDSLVLVKRGRPRWLKFHCPCGCGDIVSLNLDPRSGPYWRIFTRRKAVSILPSVWRDCGCESHFVIWKNRVFISAHLSRRRFRAENMSKPPREFE